MITHRASSSGMVAAKLFRIASSRAPRLPGLEIVRRATWGAGSSISSRPAPVSGSGSVEDNERVALRHRLARAATRNGGAHLDLDLPDGAGDVRFDVGQVAVLLFSLKP